jgi:hypothetical protein
VKQLDSPKTSQAVRFGGRHFEKYCNMVRLHTTIAWRAIRGEPLTTPFEKGENTY